MRLLGIDYGEKRVGLALSDEDGRLAFPYRVLENAKNLVEKLEAIVKSEGVGCIVVGESLDFRQKENPIMKKVHALVTLLGEKTGLPICLESEIFTTQEARRIQGKHAIVDASAAAIILQSFIDKKKFKTQNNA